MNQDESQKKDKENLSVVVAEKGLMTTSDYLKKMMELTNQDVDKKFKSLKKGIGLTAKYLEMGEGESKRFMFLGFTLFKSTDENDVVTEKPAVKLLDRNKQLFLSPNTVLANSLQDVPEFSAVEIIYIGEVKMTGGRKYKNYDINLLY
jgi:hypothetical protein